MPHQTILNHGSPWMVCLPQDQQDLTNFVTNAAFQGSSLTTRPANVSEIAKYFAELAIHAYRGGDPLKFFGTSL